LLRSRTAVSVVLRCSGSASSALARRAVVRPRGRARLLPLDRQSCVSSPRPSASSLCVSPT